MNTIQAALVWTLVAVASIISAHAAATQRLEFKESEGMTITIYN